MNTAGFIKIETEKATLFLTSVEFKRALQRGKMILRRSKQTQRELKAHVAADLRRDKMLGMREV